MIQEGGRMLDDGVGHLHLSKVVGNDTRRIRNEFAGCSPLLWEPTAAGIIVKVFFILLFFFVVILSLGAPEPTEAFIHVEVDRPRRFVDNLLDVRRKRRTRKTVGERNEPLVDIELDELKLGSLFLHYLATTGLP